MDCLGMLTWFQALQLPGLALCLLILFFLCGTVRNLSLFLVPALYFISLTTSFILPLKNLFEVNAAIQGVLIVGETLIPPLSFLLIIQLISGRTPPLFYWSILAVPLIGGSSLVYATLITQDETCVSHISEHLCGNPIVFKQLYDIFSSSLTFLLTVVVHRRIMDSKTEGTPYLRMHKFMLIMALVGLNLAVLGVTLGQLNGVFSAERAALAVTIVRTGFMYLVMTSIFRIFESSFEVVPERSLTL